ncbi:MAG: amino acid adenylation domain-containing protein [Actinomycetota bacterium]
MALTYLLHQLLESSAARFPRRIAVIDRDRSITYAELERRANRLAHLLIEQGVEKGDRVGFYLDKSFESVLAIYGILKTGACYVPLDPHAPPARLAYIARNAGIRHLLTGTEKAASWPGILDAGAPIESLVVLNAAECDLRALQGRVRGMAARDIDEAPGAPPGIEMIGFDLAYLLYTSGSTGDPKGVMLSHLNALTFIDWGVETFGVGPEDVVSSHAPLHFDLSIFDLFAAASAGATVVLVPPETSVFPAEVARFIRERRITIWYSVPSILSMMVLRGGLARGDFPALRTLLFAGEVFPIRYLRKLMGLLPHVRFSNLYGPTETNVCTHYDVPPLSEDRTRDIPIGKAIANVEVFAVTGEGRLAAPGEEGELYVRGATVMQGYWGDPERTAAMLGRSPLDGTLADPVYRTGDLVRQGEDGAYGFLGRRDAQIKSRGYRIELGDIESALYAHPGVVECAVTAIPDEVETNRIKAHVVVRNGVGDRDLVRFCADRIPRYMIPELFEFHETLPKTSTGKIDRQALRSRTPSPRMTSTTSTTSTR